MPLTIFKQSHHLAGNAPDTTPAQFDLKPPALVVDIAIFDQTALVSFSSDGIYYSTEREIPAGVIASLNLLVMSLRIRNKTASAIARYDITAFFSPIEVVGETYKTIITTP